MNDTVRYLLIGNSTAAIGAAEGIRDRDKTGRILLYSRERCHTYSRPLISYLLAGKIGEERMIYRPREFYTDNGIETRLGSAITSIDAKKRVVTDVDGRRTGFDKLLIATGGKPVIPAVENDASRGVFTFTCWDDARAIDGFLRERRRECAVVVGGGLIGIKAAQALHARGLHVFIVELGKRLLPTILDDEASLLAARELAEAGVDVTCGATASRIVSDNGLVSSAVLSNGREIVCDLVIMAVGVKPDVEMARDAGIEVSSGIIVDENMQTSCAGIYAAGDVVQTDDKLAGTSRPIPVLPNAYRQGRIAGAAMAGVKTPHDGFFAMNSLQVFGLPIISVGLATAEGSGYEILKMKMEGRRSYRRMVLRGKQLVGALFVGEIERAGIITGIIRDQLDVSGFHDLLLSDRFGLLSLPAQYRKHVIEGEGMMP